MVTSVMVTSICSGSGTGAIMMSKSESSEMDHAQLGNPSTQRISGSADHTGFLTDLLSLIPMSLARVQSISR
jgi:hypothetical protein